MAGGRLSQAEFARQNGWSRQYVAKLVQQGRIKLKGGKIDPVAAKQAIEQLAEPSTVLREQSHSRTISGGTDVPAVSQPPATTSPTDNRKAVDYAAARTMREVLRAKMIRLDYEEREGKLVDADKVYEEGFQTGRQVRDALLGIPDRLADILAAESDSARVRQRLFQEMEEALQQLVKP